MIRLTKTKGKDGRPTYLIKDKLNWLVPGDIHLPFHDKEAVEATFFYSPAAEGLFITGDLLDYYWLSSWPKNVKSTKIGGLKKHREAIDWFVKETYPLFGNNVVYGAGNHEARLETLTRKYPGFDGNWWWMFEDILPKGWQYLDHGYRAVLPQKYNGLPIVIEHGDRAQYGGVPSAQRLVCSYPNQCTIIGHNHRVETHHKLTWKAGKAQQAAAFTVGHLSDITKNNYANNPDWHLGFANIRTDGAISNSTIVKGKLL